MSIRILAADDNEEVLDALELLFKSEGMNMVRAGSPSAVIEEVKRRDFDLLLLDLNYSRDTTSGREGLALLKQIRTLDSPPPVILMTAWGSVSLAVAGIREGAADFLEKPWDNRRLLSLVRTQVDLHRGRSRERKLEEMQRVLSSRAADRPIAVSRAMIEVLALSERVAAAPAPVLITGEPGTGKGVLARFIHHCSPRASKKLVTVNIGSLTAGLFESEMFGHVRGAFTDAKDPRIGRFELADGSSLFLDEIADIPPAQQTVLLRVLEEGEYERVGSSKTRRADVRIIAATNANLQQAMEEGRFRRDLFYRLNTVHIHLPALRDRPSDITPLAEHYLNRFRLTYRRPDLEFSEEAKVAMAGYSWPGNVRELSHAVERGVLVAGKKGIRPSDLGLIGVSPTESHPLEAMTLDEAERFLILAAVRRHGRRMNETAKALGLSRSAFYRRLERHGLQAEDF